MLKGNRKKGNGNRSAKGERIKQRRKYEYGQLVAASYLWTRRKIYDCQRAREREGGGVAAICQSIVQYLYHQSDKIITTKHFPLCQVK